MDLRSEGLVPGKAARHPFQFEGSGGEYFKIWIVNLALSIITLGIFSAWAKVRTRRYFLGNTVLAGHNFEYHGQPLRILLGRVIALVLLGGYSLSIHLGGPKFVLAWLVVFAIALPWLVKSSFRFNARNTSYRNVRFNFSGTYGGAFKAFVLWYFAMVVSLFTLTPFAHRARDYYHINNHSFGGRKFTCEFEIGPLYGIYLLSILFFMLGIAALIGAIASTGVMAVIAGMAAHKSALPPVLIPIILMFMLGYLVLILFVGAYFRTRTFNLVLNSTAIDGGLKMEADLPVVGMMWILFSNVFLTLITLGIFYPFALVRQTRFMVEHMAVEGDATLDDVVDTAQASPGAIGEEVASFFDIDFGL